MKTTVLNAAAMEDILVYVDIVSAVRAFYLLSIFATLLVRFIPAFRDRFLQYGARDATATTTKTAATDPASKSLLLPGLLDQIAAIRVPHSTFWHFYALSIACTSLCLVAVVWKPAVLDLLPRSSSSGSGSSSSQVSSPARVVLCLLLLGCQGVRRLWECISLSRAAGTSRTSSSSSSSMWIGHYLIGLAFYVFANVGLVVDHLGALSLPPSVPAASTQVAGPSKGLGLAIQTAAFIGFVAASWKQHGYHVYLAGLKRYTLPTEGAFKVIVAPHYTAECAIYLALAILSAPIDGSGSGSGGGVFNVTILCALAFVIANLGITADGTKRWMMVKFSESRVEIERRWRMIPGLF